MARRHDGDAPGNSDVTNGTSGNDALLGRRGYLTLAGAALVGGLGTTASAADYRTVTVPAGGSETFSLGSGDTLENVLIDVTANDADVFIKARGTGWTIRNVGIRGKLDIGDDNNVLDSQYGGGYHQVLNCQGEGVIENVYLGDGVVEGVDRTAMNVGRDHADHIEMRRCNVGRWSSNAIYAAGFGRVTGPGPTDGAGGTIAFRSCYFHDNNVAHLRLAADGTVVENCTMENTNDVPVLPLSNGGAENVINSRGIYTGYGDPSQVISVRGCDIDITAENTDGAASAAVSDDHSTFGELSTVRIEDSQVRGRLVGSHVETRNVGDNPDTSIPSGVPTSAEEAAAGTSSDDGSTGGDSGADSGQDSFDSTLSISGGSPSNVVTYEFRVSDEIRKTTARNASIDDDDVIESDGSVSGGVAGGADGYEFSGELTGFSLDGDATVYLDGQQVDPSTLGGEETPPNYVVIDGGDDGRWTRYEFSVDGAVEKSDEWGSVNGHDAVDGTTVSGWVKDGVDSYRYSGDIGSFDIYGPVDVRFGTDE
jgi:hypothetical protein